MYKVIFVVRTFSGDVSLQSQNGFDFESEKDAEKAIDLFFNDECPIGMGSDKWVTRLYARESCQSKESLAEPLPLPRIGAWITSKDCGISSNTMLSIALGYHAFGSPKFDAPYDVADFGRCKRLVEFIPQMRNYFTEIGKYEPRFKGILDNWDNLCHIYDRDKDLPSSGELYTLIKQLRGPQ